MSTVEELVYLRFKLKNKFHDLNQKEEIIYDRILIIDDNVLCNKIHKKTLQNYNLAKNIITFENLQDSLEYLKNNIVDIIFVNIALAITPETSYLKTLNKYTKHVICMSITPSMNDDMIIGEHCVYISKPIKISKFKSLLEIFKKAENNHK